MKPYYQQDGLCECGCGVAVKRRFVSGHNRRGVITTDSHKKAIASAQKNAWDTKRERLRIGSTWIDAGGYVRVKVAHGAVPWQLQHVMVIEQCIGRKLHPFEVVHHINGRRDDNRVENLFLCENRSHHNAIENNLKAAARAAIEAGVIVWDGAGGYRLA